MKDPEYLCVQKKAKTFILSAVVQHFSTFTVSELFSKTCKLVICFKQMDTFSLRFIIKGRFSCKHSHFTGTKELPAA